MRTIDPIFALVFISTPAFADHTGPSGVGAGGGLNVIAPGTLDAGATSIGFRLTYSRPDQRTAGELEALAGEHIHAHNTDYNLNAAAGIAYGITPHLTVSAELPYVRRDNLREGEHPHVNGAAINEVVQLGDVAGVGDISVLAKYRVTDGESGGFAVIGGIKAPTGNTHKLDLAGEPLETEHQPGTGSWDPIIGVSAGATIGALAVSASALYQFSGHGAQDTQLGDRAQGGIALSHHFGPAADHHDEADEDHHGHSHEQIAAHGHQSIDAFVEVTGEWEGRQTVAGAIESESGGTAVWLTPGARLNTASGFTIRVSSVRAPGQTVRARASPCLSFHEP